MGLRRGVRLFAGCGDDRNGEPELSAPLSSGAGRICEMSLPGDTVEVVAGPHDRLNCPMIVELPGLDRETGALVDRETGETLPVQRLGDSRYGCILPAMNAGGRRRYRLAEPSSGSPIGVEARTENCASVAVYEGNELVTRYAQGHGWARPCFYPVHAPGAIPLTRSWPIRTDVAAETRDHKHHRSLWTA